MKEGIPLEGSVKKYIHLVLFITCLFLLVSCNQHKSQWETHIGIDIFPTSLVVRIDLPRFEKEYGYFRPVIQDVVERYLDCGNPMCGFARIRCPGCGEERLLMYSCKIRGFCPSYHAKRREEWGEWMREELLMAAEERGEYF